MPALLLPVGIDFARFDRDMRAIADRIEAAGRSAVIELGAEPARTSGASVSVTPAQLAPAVDPRALTATMGGLGRQIADGIADGIRVASGTMTAFLARTNAMFDRLAGVSIATFTRIDAALKFPGFDEFLTKASERLRETGTRIGRALAVPIDVYRGYSRLMNFVSTFGSVANKTFSGMFGAVKLPLIGNVFGAAPQKARELDTAVRSSTSSVAQLNRGIRSVGASILAAFGFVGVIYKTVTFLRDGAKAASDLNETASRAQVVFGGSFGKVEDQARRLAASYGVSRKAQLDVAAGYAAMAQGAGISEAASADLANQLTQMAADLSSSVNISFEEAGQKIRAALAGEAEPLRQFGANITETAVQSYALSSGLARSAREINDQTRIVARAQLIMRGLSYAQGDLERTSSSAANQFRRAGGGIQEFGIRIGELLLPAITAATSGFNDFMAIILEVFEASLPTLKGWFDYLSGAMGVVGVLVRNFGAVWQDVQLRIGAFAHNAVAWIRTIPANFGPITEWIGRNWWALLKDLASTTATVFGNLLENASRFGMALWEAIKGNGFEFTWTPLLDGFKATTERLPELIRPALVNVDDEVAKVWDQVADKEARRLATISQVKAGGVKPPGPLAAEAKVVEPKLASAVEIGSKEASSILARAANQPGNRQLDVARQSLDVGRQSHQELREIRRVLDRSPMVIQVR